MILAERIRRLNDRGSRPGDYVLYWMQSSARAEFNHALGHAIDMANEAGRPLLAIFCLTEDYPDANQRHYRFLLEGLREAQTSLEEMNIRLVVRRGSPDRCAVELSGGATLAIVDRGYTRIQRAWRSWAAEGMRCPLIQVEGEVVVPVEAASPKEEYSAATFRPKLRRLLPRFLVPLKRREPEKSSLGVQIESHDISDPGRALEGLGVDRSVGTVEGFRGGTSQAKDRLDTFVRGKLDRYPELRNDPTVDGLSNLSPYLHFGQISPLYVALKVNETESLGREAFLEELIVRRELAVNFVRYNSHYDSFDCLPEWCRRTLEEHEKDPREYVYTLEEFEEAETHDPYWNAAQREMIATGKMHGYMRMYWGKKILEWTENPREAYEIAVRLNDKYELDGRDSNGYAGVAWCFGKHDRPWRERPTFGKVRYMNDRGLRRKFDADLYVEKVRRLG